VKKRFLTYAYQRNFQFPVNNPLMSIKGILCVVFFIVSTTRPSVAQDKIYLASSTKQGKITAISAATITYRPTSEKSQLINIPISNVVLMINDKGGWLTPTQLNFEDEKTKETINEFLTQDNPSYAEDRIYSIDGIRIDGKILDEDDKSITAVVNNVTKQIPKNAVLAILYRNGRHVIFGTITDARDALVKARPATAKPVAISTGQKDNQNHSSKTAIIENGTDNAAVTEPLTFEAVAGNVNKSEFEAKASQKTNQFSAYLKILCDKSAPQDERNKAINLALDLFVNEDAIVQTSSITTGSIDSLKIKRYLLKVKMLNYDKIELDWTNVSYVTDVRLAPDNTWRGTITFEQTFKGYRDGQVVYKDITTKKAEVIMKAYTKNVEGQRVSDWDVLLGDIGVKWTEKATN
jgi:hypothetical protein